MTAIFIAVVIIAYILVFIFSLVCFFIAYKHSDYGVKDIYSYVFCFLVFGCLGFFVANHFALMTSDKSITLAMGYAAMPITQMSIAILSYPMIVLFKDKIGLKYPPVFLGILASAPLSFLLTSTLSFYYWQFLGDSYFGK